MGRRSQRKEKRQADAPKLRKTHFLGPALIVVAGLLAYANSFSGPFLFDDKEGITENVSLRHPWRLADVLSPPRQSTVAGRPILNLSFAMNYAIGGVSPRGYHIVNLIIHLCAALVLFGIVRRTFESQKLQDEYSTSAMGLATATAILWAVHPLQTESVTYVVQRAESLMGLFYLLTLYAVIRHAERPSTFWLVVAIGSCALGMGTKEVMVTAPVVALLYDRTFLSGSFGAALRQRWRLYAGLAATWLILAILVAGAPRSMTAGLRVRNFTPATYALTQLGVIVHYLRLSLWPHPLCLDYGWPPANTLRDLPWSALGVVVLAGATLWAIVRRPAIGFLGAWFFLILSPTSSVVPIKDAAFEHRMYLSLAAIVVFVVFIAANFIRQIGAKEGAPLRYRPAIAAIVLAVVASLLSAQTFARNRDYESETRMWTDVVNKRPANPRGHFGLGVACAAVDQFDDAIRHYQDALVLDPNDARTHNNLAIVYAKQGRKTDAIAEYELALKLQPDHAEAHNNLGVLLADEGKTQEAIEHYQAAIRADSNWAGAHNNLGNALAKLGRLTEAADAYRAALALEPNSANAHNNLASLLVQLGRVEEALPEYAEAVRLVPSSIVIHTNYADCLLRLGRKAEAAAEYRRILATNPNDAKVRAKLEAAMQNAKP